MKKKIVSLMLSLLFATSLLTGCGLFTRNPDAYLTQVVAQVEDVVVTKEDFINAYYNYGSSLIQQNGLTQKEAVKQTIEMLLERGLLLKHVKALAAQEVKDGLEQEDYLYELTNKEYNEAVKTSWDYVDEQVRTIVSKYVDLDSILPEESKEEETESDYPVETAFEQTVVLEQVGTEWRIRRKTEEFENDDSKLDVLKYVKEEYTSDFYMNKAWAEYMQNLRDEEKQRNYSSKNNQEILERELNRLFKLNLDNKYLEKFQTSYESKLGFDQDGYMTDVMEQKILNKYKLMYNANVEEYNVARDSFYTNVTSTDKSKNYVYFVESEAVLEVQHILIKFDEDEITKIKDSPYLTPEEKDERIAYLKSQEGTIAKLRDAEGNETETTISVKELYNNVILNLVASADADYTRGTDAYADYMSTEFNKLVYQYNQDEGIMNAQFDYRISTGHSAMVEGFTKATRDLYTVDGFAGAVSAPVESEYGYHIIILSNVCSNLTPQNADIQALYNKRTSRSAVAEDNYVEYLLSQVNTAEYSDFETRVIDTLKSGLTFKYFESRYKDYL